LPAAQLAADRADAARRHGSAADAESLAALYRADAGAGGRDTGGDAADTDAYPRGATDAGAAVAIRGAFRSVAHGLFG
jgi:hypothetical protein